MVRLCVIPFPYVFSPHSVVYRADYRPPVSRWDRILVFGGLNVAAAVLIIICFSLFPVLTLRPTKFAILYVDS